MITSIQFVGIVFALFMLFLTYYSFKRKSFKIYDLIFWGIIWIGVLFASIFPSSLRTVVSFFNVADVMSLMIVLAFIILFINSFYLYYVVRKSQIKIEYVVKELSFERKFKRKTH